MDITIPGKEKRAREKENWNEQKLTENPLLAAVVSNSNGYLRCFRRVAAAKELSYCESGAGTA